jgi:hypothetical protein
MNKFLIFLFSFICASHSEAQMKTSLDTEVDLAKSIIQTSEFAQLLSYSPSISFFLGNGFGSLKDGPNGINTYIHEAIHTYNNIKSAGSRNALYYYHDSSTLLKVNVLQGYITTDSIFTYLPDFVKNKSLTQTYITCNNNCFSKTRGIYGLLEEFNASAQHVSAMVKFFNYFDSSEYTSTLRFWNGYLKCKYDSWMNFYYFQIYFGTYLKYLKVNHFNYYNQLIVEESFRESFMSICNKYYNALNYLDFYESIILNKRFKGNLKKYNYPFAEEFYKVKAISESEGIEMYLAQLFTPGSS